MKKALPLLAGILMMVTIVAAISNAHRYPVALSALTLLVTGGLAGLWLGAGRQRRLVVDLTRALEQQTATAQQMTALAQEEAKKRTQIVEAVGIVEGERNKWKEMFINCALGHSAAQNMMLRERERLIFRMRQLGDKPERFLDPAVEKTLAEFKEKYADPATLEKGDRISPPIDKPAGHE